MSDGDTVVLSTDAGERVTVRLAEIDAPEGDQPYGKESRELLFATVYRRHVEVAVKTIDAYGRTVGRVFTADRDVCDAMVTSGAAWAYRQY